MRTRSRQSHHTLDLTQSLSTRTEADQRSAKAQSHQRASNPISFRSLKFKRHVKNKTQAKQSNEDECHLFTLMRSANCGISSK